MLSQYANNIPNLAQDVTDNVKAALAEDIGTGDITAELIPPEQTAKAQVITREDCIFCGKDWVQETFRQLDPAVEIIWHINDGEAATAGQVLFELSGSSRSLLSGERTALNFVQLLSGTASAAHRYAKLVEGTDIAILDTRKTIPGLRSAQKYAVACGGCQNHRLGLYDAFLIKENHIAACGGVAAAIAQARKIAPGKPIEVEVETLPELDEAIAAEADIVMLDEMEITAVRQHLKGREFTARLEASGNIDLQVASTLKDYEQLISRISIGALTKHITCIDLSMRLTIIDPATD